MNWKHWIELNRILSDNFLHPVKLRESHHGYELYQGTIYNLPKKLTQLSALGWQSYYDCRYIRFHYFPRKKK